MFLDPRHAEYLKEIRELHGVGGMHSKTVIFEMKANFLDYGAACENMHSAIVSPIISISQEVYIYSVDEGESIVVMSD